MPLEVLPKFIQNIAVWLPGLEMKLGKLFAAMPQSSEIYFYYWGTSSCSHCYPVI
ncbi:hypothetical protein [Peribacillus faecalis]|uniref:hypothetical protein n=1 Tax=Peribacillus faecalis TaxID=2772559 RepID=UPI0038B2BEEC